MHGLSSRVKFVLAAILFVIGLLKLVDWAAEYLWFEALGYDSVFWALRGLKVAIFIAAFLLSLAFLSPFSGLISGCSPIIRIWMRSLPR